MLGQFIILFETIKIYFFHIIEMFINKKIVQYHSNTINNALYYTLETVN